MDSGRCLQLCGGPVWLWRICTGEGPPAQDGSELPPIPLLYCPPQTSQRLAEGGTGEGSSLPLSVRLPPAWARPTEESFLSSDIFPKLHHQLLLALFSLESRGHPRTQPQHSGPDTAPPCPPQVFREQGIDGETLPLLTEEHLLTTMGLKLGPALKIRAQVST